MNYLHSLPIKLGGELYEEAILQSPKHTAHLLFHVAEKDFKKEPHTLRSLKDKCLERVESQTHKPIRLLKLALYYPRIANVSIDLIQRGVETICSH